MEENNAVFPRFLISKSLFLLEDFSKVFCSFIHLVTVVKMGPYSSCFRLFFLTIPIASQIMPGWDFDFLEPAVTTTMAKTTTPSQPTTTPTTTTTKTTTTTATTTTTTKTTIPSTRPTLETVEFKTFSNETKSKTKSKPTEGMIAEEEEAEEEKKEEEEEEKVEEEKREAEVVHWEEEEEELEEEERDDSKNKKIKKTKQRKKMMNPSTRYNHTVVKSPVRGGGDSGGGGGGGGGGGEDGGEGKEEDKGREGKNTRIQNITVATQKEITSGTLSSKLNHTEPRVTRAKMDASAYLGMS